MSHRAPGGGEKKDTVGVIERTKSSLYLQKRMGRRERPYAATQRELCRLLHTPVSSICLHKISIIIKTGAHNATHFTRQQNELNRRVKTRTLVSGCVCGDKKFELPWPLPRKKKWQMFPNLIITDVCHSTSIARPWFWVNQSKDGDFSSKRSSNWYPIRVFIT